MFKITNNNKIDSGISMPIAIILTFCGVLIFFSYTSSQYNKYWQIQYQYAEQKAQYNADSGIALEAVGARNIQYSLYDRLFSVPGGENDAILASGLIDNMGSYDVELKVKTNEEYQVIKSAQSTGIATIKNSLYGDNLEIKKTRYLELSNTSSLSDFLYLTASERAGGAPYVFDGYPTLNNRREVNFGSSDSFNTSWPNDEPVCDVQIKTNGTFVMSDFGCPTFENTVTIIENPDGTYNSPDMGFCNENQVFQGDPPLDTASTTCLPPPGYESMKQIIENSNDHIFLDATTKLNWTPTYYTRDTLIMTDIEFITENGGGVKVKQWWYLMPPYLNSNIEMPFVFSTSIDDPANCDNSNLYSCDNYTESMEDFHAKNVNSQGYDFPIDPIVQSNFGFHHYDIPNIHSPGSNWVSQLTDNQLLPQYQTDGHIIYYTNRPTAIYVKGGPVRVHGTYKGRYTVVTDEYVTYNRHAWGSNLSAQAGGGRVDTLWGNIWITGDLENDDASWNGSLINAQPDEQCENGSENILGLVSGANVYVANTLENGARNSWQGTDIDIHAHIIAFKESFSVQYWQNTMSTTGFTYSNPPYGDGQGVAIYGNGGTTDDRGTINLWGGIVQKYRGYTVRTNPGPYPTNTIGYGKNYNFDCNLKCAYPPLYPENTTCDEDDTEINYSVTKYF